MQADDRIVLRRPPRFRSSRSLFSVVGVGLLFCLIVMWSMVWFAATQQTESLLDAWIQHEKSVDRIWTCPDRRIAGFPFKIEISCAKAGFSGEIFGKQVVGSLQGFHVNASLLHPDQADAVTEPPFALRSQDGDDEIALQWDTMHVHIDGLPEDLTYASIEGSNVSVQGGLKGLGALMGRAGRVTSLVNVVPERRAENAYAFHLVFEDAAAPVLDQLLGSTPPDAIKLDGIVTKADFRTGGTMAERLEHWRGAGGRLEVSDVMLARGATKIAAHGILQLDDQHRPQGQLATDFSGVEPLLRRLGVNPAIVGAGSLLSSLLGGGKPNANAAADGSSALHLPVTLAAGLVSIGPVKTSLAVPPLY